jgi:signal transduction histidine kinase
MEKHSTEFQLKERIKELNCLYELSRIALEQHNDLKAIITKTLQILPPAMQYPALAEVQIQVHRKTYATKSFDQCLWNLSAPLKSGASKYGIIKIGYRKGEGLTDKQTAFLKEERNLIHIVARELSSFIHRDMVEADKQKLQEQLQHAERLSFVGELSAGIAHELNEPLGKILGFSQLLKKAGDLNPQQEEDLERIIKASLYTREIIKKLMIFSRQMPQQIVGIDLNTIISSTLYFIDIRYQEHQKINIVEQLDPDLPMIEADSVQMSQVLVNLITNAVHATPEGGKITVRTRYKDNQVLLVVRDTGTGMTSEVKKNYLNPFLRPSQWERVPVLDCRLYRGSLNPMEAASGYPAVKGRVQGLKFNYPLSNQNHDQERNTTDSGSADCR